MRVYVYDSPDGLIADFRPYLDGLDHAFEPPRPMKGNDPRWEKVQSLYCPRSGDSLHGQLRYAGMGEIHDYHELMVFPVPYEGEVVAKES